MSRHKNFNVLEAEIQPLVNEERDNMTKQLSQTCHQ